MTAVDPYEGLPAHMLQSIPLNVQVEVGAEVHSVQLERDSRPLTIADKIPGWTPGDRDGWREWPAPKWESPVSQPAWDVFDVYDAEECE